MYKKKFIIILTIICLGIALIVLTGCSNEEVGENGESVNTTAGTSTNETAEGNSVSNSTETNNETSKERVVDTIDYKEAAEKQMALPEKGETIAIIKVKGFGEMKFKFFPEVAPKAVENFLTHAKNGYYDGLTFHRVINEFMIQGGDPEGTGMGGESIWGEGFGTELSYELVPYRGSLCMAMSSLPNSIGSQFFITQAHYNESMLSYLKQGGYPEGLLEEYGDYGGYLSLYLQYTVFGQAFEGMDIVDKVAAVKTNDNDKPLEDVIIESIEVTTYSK